MSFIDDLGDEMAQRVLRLMAESGDEGIVSQIDKFLGSTSQSLQEAFMTAYRVRRAHMRAQAMLDAIEKGLK